MMKLVVFCLLAIASNVVMCSTDLKLIKLSDVLKELDDLRKFVVDNDSMLHTPTNDIEECCSVSALHCFRNSMPLLSTTTKKILQKKVTRNLMNEKIINAVNNCGQDEIQNASCKACKTYPMRSSKEFLEQLKVLLQKAYERHS